MAQKISRWLLIALVLSLGFGQLLRFDFFGVPLYLHDILVVAALCALTPVLLPPRRKNFAIPFGLKLFFLGLALGWFRALTLYPIHALLIPSLYTLRLLAYLTLYLVLKSQKIKIPRNIFIISGLVACLIGLSQYTLMPDMRVFKYLGWDDHLNRLILPHFDPTFSGIMLGLFLLTLSPNLWYFGLFAIIGMLLTYARSVWVSLAVASSFFIKPKKLVLFVIPLALVAILFLPHRFGEGTNLLRTYSITSRFESDATIVKKTGWNLLVGQGMNTFPKNSINDSYLYLLATSGILGLVGFLFFMKDLYVRSRVKPMIVFVLVASLFNNILFYPFALVWMLLAQFTDSKSA